MGYQELPSSVTTATAKKADAPSYCFLSLGSCRLHPNEAVSRKTVRHGYGVEHRTDSGCTDNLDLNTPVSQSKTRKPIRKLQRQTAVDRHLVGHVLLITYFINSKIQTKHQSNHPLASLPTSAATPISKGIQPLFADDRHRPTDHSQSH